MRHKFGIVCMILGGLILLSALVLYVVNQQEASRAGERSAQYLALVQEAVAQQSPAYSASSTPENPVDPQEDSPLPSVELTEQGVLVVRDMTVVEIDGHAFVGYLSIPSLGLNLPVMAETTTADLKITPCRYSGGTYTEDLVIGGHNYKQHFAKLYTMQPGDEVRFTDMDGKVWQYEAVSTETLKPSDGKILTSGEYPLTLYSCTYDGQSRVVLRCTYLQ